SALGAGLGLAMLPAQTPRGQKVPWKDGWEGPWSVVSWTQNGRLVPENYSRAIQVTFRGQKVTFTMFGKRRQGPVKVDGTKSPGWFDLEFDPGELPRKAIYRLERDRLTLCIAASYRERPTRFESKPGTDTNLIVLRRGPVRLDRAEERRARRLVAQEDKKLE